MALPFVVVIIAQMAAAGFSIFALSSIRAYVTGESLWSKGQHDAIYYLNLYLDTDAPADLARFDKAINVPVLYRTGRQLLEQPQPDTGQARTAFLAAGHPSADISRLIWSFVHFHTFPYLRDAIDRWRETDPYILELKALGDAARAANTVAERTQLRDRIRHLDTEITPRTVAFSLSLGHGALVVEEILLVTNLVMAAILALLSFWRVRKFLKHRRQFENELAWQASHDELTGLPNRRAFEERLSLLQQERGGQNRRGRAVMFIDLDQFKIVNDTCGHAAGDALLRVVCAPLRTLLRKRDVLARLGGDEFSVLMPECDVHLARGTAEDIRTAVENIDFVWGGRRFAVTASVGLVHDASGDLSSEEMMRTADLACFMAKEKGRNRVHLHCDTDEDLIGRVKEMTWVQRIHQALSEDRFCLYAQEIRSFRAPDPSERSFEILLRLRADDGSVVPPSAFLPAAERFGLMTLVDRWVVQNAFRMVANHCARHSKDRKVPFCWINLSGATVGDEAFLDFLKGLFHSYDLPPNAICFEVTETSAVVSLEAARTFILDLRALGCSFALDDFGSGMSSFRYLKTLPVDYLKIDGDFVKNLMTDPSDRTVVEMITRVGHVTGKKIVAESVETAAVSKILEEIGVDLAQGFGIAHPLPFDVALKSGKVTGTDRAA